MNEFKKVIYGQKYEGSDEWISYNEDLMNCDDDVEIAVYELKEIIKIKKSVEITKVRNNE